LYAFETAQHGLGCKLHGFAPAERFFNAFAEALAYGLSGAPRCAAIDGRALGFCRHMRRYIHGSQLVDEIFGIVSLIGAQGDTGMCPVRATMD
jgi:hypothetical protein